MLPASATLAPGGTQSFTANVSQNTNGAAINPVVLNGLTITFAGGGLGSVSPGSAALSGLMAGTVFTASATCPTPNTGNVSATLDNGTQTSSMTVQVPPSISACPANQTVNTDPGTCTALVSFTAPTATAGCPAPTVTCRIGATPITSPHAFPVGTSTVTCTASNGVAPDASCSFTVTVNDTENPAITCPANITATENPPGSGAAVVTYAAPVGTDACPGATTVQTAGLASGNAFPVGVTTNTFRVTDAAGNMANCSFTVTVVLAPDLSLMKSHTGNFTQGQTGAEFTVTVTNSGGSPTSGAVTLSDTVPTGLTPTAASGVGWNCGITGAMVNCTRSDALAPAASYPPVTLTVDVAPNAPPSVTNTATVSGGGDVNTTNNTASDVTTILPAACVISCPSNITVPNDPGQCGAIVSFTAPTVTGGCGPVSCTPSSGSFFPVGTTTVTCANGAGTSCSFTVTVIDTENPVINCPANIVVTESSPGSGSAVVTYTAPVGTDACPGATTMQTAGLASGSAFPVGVTTNTFRVMDAAGNMANCSFTVTVTATPTGLLLELPESGRPVSLTLNNIPPTMSSIGIQNGNPGVLYIEIIINGRLFETVGLSNGEVKSINISSQLPLDSNTIILTGYGQPGGRANVVLN